LVLRNHRPLDDLVGNYRLNVGRLMLGEDLNPGSLNPLDESSLSDLLLGVMKMMLVDLIEEMNLVVAHSDLVLKIQNVRV
jgi:hypothetical protein